MSSRGASEYAQEFSRALIELGHQVKVFTVLPESAKQADFDSTLVDKTSKAKYRFPIFALKLPFHIQEDEYDIIHSQGGAGMFCKRIDVETFHHYQFGIAQRIQAIPNMLSARRAKALIAISKKTKDEIRASRFLRRSAVKIIHNGVNVEFLRYIQNLGPPKKTGKRLLHVNADLSKRKNLPLALRTLAEVRKKFGDVELDIVGPDWGKSRAMAEAKWFDVNQQVNYYSNLSIGSLAQLYASSDLLLVPSIQEGFGLPLAETVAAGVPFVSFDVGIASELAINGYGHVARSAEEFIYMAGSILENPEPIGRTGFDFVNKNLTWELCAQKALELYKRTISA
jgi:glycosyltransferase involved in cell wall biosynthesis